jgi:Uma2 family endonuclease
MGLFQGQRAELVEGTIMVFSPQKWAHAAGVDRTGDALKAAFGPGFWVRTQLPLHLNLFSDPEPGVSVVSGRREEYTDHPTSAVLVVEVSDTTLAYDQGEKAGMYARADIADYWVLDLVHGCLEVYRSPLRNSGEPSGFRYAHRATLGRGQHVAPLAAPAVTVAVADLLG